MLMAAQSAPSASTASVLARAMCITLQCHYLGNHRKVETEKFVKDTATTGQAGTSVSLDASVDTDQFHVTKKLVDPKELRSCMALLARAKVTLQQLAIPAHRVFGQGTYLIPNELVQLAVQRLKDIRGELVIESGRLADRYASAVAKQAVALGKSFDPKEYPSTAQVRDAFGIEWKFVSFSVPDELKSVDQAIFDEATARYDADMATAYSEVRLALRESLCQLVADVAKKLEPGADGKPKVFRNTILEGLSGFLETFQFRNLTDDAGLAAAVKQLRALTAGVTPDTLRDSDALRERIATTMQDAAKHLDALVREERAISFTDL